jgi:hypothetical protein
MILLPQPTDEEARCCPNVEKKAYFKLCLNLKPWPLSLASFTVTAESRSLPPWLSLVWGAV